MADRRAPRPPLFAVLLGLSVAVWTIGIVYAPLVGMAARSIGEPATTAGAASAELAHTRADLVAARRDWDHAADPERRAELDRRIRLLVDRLARIERGPGEPKDTWTAAAWTELADHHGGALARTLAGALATTLVALVLGHPLACAVALAATPARARLLLAALVVPAALPEPLRLRLWTRFVAPDGPLAALLAGLDPHGSAGLGAVVATLSTGLSGSLLLVVLSVLAALAGLDRRQIAAARDLGASPRLIHARFVLPRARPGLALGAAAAFAAATGSEIAARVAVDGTGGDGFAALLGRGGLGTAASPLAAAGAGALTLAGLLVALLAAALARARVADLLRRRD